MKKMQLLINGRPVDVYVEGDFDRVQVAQAGASAFTRADSVTIGDTLMALATEGVNAENEPATIYVQDPSGTQEVQVQYEVSVGDVEDL